MNVDSLSYVYMSPRAVVPDDEQGVQLLRPGKFSLEQDSDTAQRESPPPKSPRSKSAEGRIASIMHVLTLPLTTSMMRKHLSMQMSPDLLQDLSDDDISAGDESEHDRDDTDNMEDNAAIEALVTSDQEISVPLREGRLIPRRRSKQLSKGRRGLRRIRVANSLESKMNASDASLDKFVKLAELRSFETDAEASTDA